MYYRTLSKWISAFGVYLQPRPLILLFLGFSSGLPLLLVFSSLSFWLREAGIERSTIGLISWVALAYAFKWVWAPLVDRIKLPILGNLLGRRRSWMLVAQLGVAGGLLGMALNDPAQNLEFSVWMALLVAFCSATQDITVDAYRIESGDERLQAAMAATYMVGYRLAMITSTAGVLALAAFVDPSEETYQYAPWLFAYGTMAMLMIPGILTTLLSPEPAAPANQELESQIQQVQNWIAHSGRNDDRFARAVGWIYITLVSPFADFIKRYRWQALLILALIGSYRIADIVMGVIANVFYVDIGFTKAEIAAVTKVFGVIMTLVGALAGGVLVNRFGVMKILFTGALLAAGTNLLFALMALNGPIVELLMVVVSLDNFSAGIATAAFVAYLSALTNIQYSATQYALFSSIMLLLPKFLGGFSGIAVDEVGYPLFFTGTAILGLPVLVLIILAARHTQIRHQTPVDKDG
ncbi:AmpG family muropeptide MFS transporter [Marinobacterium mangrovicola]|uniref:PAT family beta-lactamase induction signal transducer AmpG n=1 Tax=Marinobacterium mangrovicola TaxID=1476959 RepID=A0A4R1GKA9_9GAMM|nr:MFS transporter [Marinobacterium mangrovicola]TCK07335.1 PAT family beta-lactamase induction signal transducer AmpG [Marinobacterium mangrovicola]